MGRCKNAVIRQPLPQHSVHTYAAHFIEFAEAQDEGLAFFGEAVYPNKRRHVRAAAFYPYRVDPPPTQDAVKLPAASSYYVEQPNYQALQKLINSPVPTVRPLPAPTITLRQLPQHHHHHQQQQPPSLQQQQSSAATRVLPPRAAAAPGFTRSAAQGARQARAPCRELTEDEVALIEDLRDEKYPLSWQDIADLHFKELHLTGAELRRVYRKAMDVLEAAAQHKVHRQPSFSTAASGSSGAGGAATAAAACRGRSPPATATSAAPTAKQAGGSSSSGRGRRRAAAAAVAAVTAAAAAATDDDGDDDGSDDEVTQDAADDEEEETESDAELTGRAKGSVGPLEARGDTKQQQQQQERRQQQQERRQQQQERRRQQQQVHGTIGGRRGRPKKVLEELPQPPRGWEAYINRQAMNRGGGDARVRLRRPMKRPPAGSTLHMVHGLKTYEGVTFYEVAEVKDTEEEKWYVFDLKEEPIHCPCFHIGEGPDGTPLLSWSTVYCFYTLADGSKWAEHSYLHDEDDLRGMVEKGAPGPEGLLPLGQYELLKRRGRYHSQLQNIEYECWIFEGKFPEGLIFDPENTYYWSRTFDPDTMQLVQEDT